MTGKGIRELLGGKMFCSLIRDVGLRIYQNEIVNSSTRKFTLNNINSSE